MSAPRGACRVRRGNDTKRARTPASLASMSSWSLTFALPAANALKPRKSKPETSVVRTPTSLPEASGGGGASGRRQVGGGAGAKWRRGKRGAGMARGCRRGGSAALVRAEGHKRGTGRGGTALGTWAVLPAHHHSAGGHKNPPRLQKPIPRVSCNLEQPFSQQPVVYLCAIGENGGLVGGVGDEDLSAERARGGWRGRDYTGGNARFVGA